MLLVKLVIFSLSQSGKQRQNLHILGVLITDVWTPYMLLDGNTVV